MFPRLFKSTAFRSAAMAAGLFALAGTLLLASLYYALTQEMLRPVRTEIEQQSGDLLKEWKRSAGRNYEAGFQAILSESVDGNATLRSEIVYAVIDKDGRIISGDPQISPSFLGWREWTPSAFEPTADADQIDSFPVLALGSKIDDVTIIVGRKLLGLGEAQEVFIRVLSIGMGVILLLALCLGWFLSRTSLRRLDEMVLATQRFAEGDLSTRLPIKGHGDDIEQLALNVNAMLARTTDLMGAMKRVSGGIAHELKSPLTRLRQKIEGLAIGGRPSKEALDNALMEMDGVIGLFNALLRITQIESGERRSKFERVDLAKVAADVLAIHEPEAAEKKQSLTFLGAANAFVLGDEMLLKQLVSNILDNAIKHTPARSAIDLKIKFGDGSVEFLVSDQGRGLNAAEKLAVFEPFRRLERSHDVAGTGLGLATVKAIADIHDARINLGDNGPGLVAKIAFPLAREGGLDRIAV